MTISIIIIIIIKIIIITVRTRGKCAMLYTKWILAVIYVVKCRRLFKTATFFAANNSSKITQEATLL